MSVENLSTTGLMFKAAAIACVAASVGSAFAATATANMTNTATVSSSCTISATGFTTTYDSVVTNASSHQDITGTLATTCTSGSSATITLGQGTNADTGSADATPLRRLSTGGGTPSYLSYSLYQNATRTTVWGNTLATGLATTGTGAAVSSTVYARITSGQATAKAGAYTDVVVATLTF